MRPSGVWVLRKNYNGDTESLVTGVDMLFGVDAVDPRPGWTLVQPPLQLDHTQEGAPIVWRGRTERIPNIPEAKLSIREDGKFKFVQISDTHMVTGVGVCTDAIDARGYPLAECEADPLTVRFLKGILDVEKPDLVLLTGDQLHHDIPDSQTTLFKVVAPTIERSIPYAAVFGNHDDEGIYAMSWK